MTKAELINQMANDAAISKAEAGKALNALTAAIGSALGKKDGKIGIPGLGTFSKTRRKARTGRNPRTGAEIKIKARNAVKFRAAKALQEDL
jgi:DNA-binding protein HU-beta